MHRDKGQSLIEVIVACSVGILVVAALTFATIFSLRNANFAKNSAQATKLAQEGIERVRTGRDRNECINNIVPPNTVQSWNDGNTNCSGSGSIWNYQITKAGGCDNPGLPAPGDGGKCYFNVDSLGALTNIGFDYINLTTPIPSAAEGIPVANPVFRRVVILSDDAGSYQTQKTVTVIVTWTDFSGPHESKLTTILRKL